ncbi:diguanylate cyclase domain-containing protein [Methylobacter sp. S3L5C]|uniref:diguanylate cyclase domain-containing protein n=1 Tax=Methylobacter sp. S3L5C TaxID=2839024 RepID=UPI001FAD832D|nr:diguanylate cyclase [Methylobacter sp. S3L5C]UOA06841.1 diguanylate cyclase [Methylobacter sp. S3L5C]
MIKSFKIQPSLLIVDDSIRDMETLVSALAEYRLFTATNSLQALTIAVNVQPDLILLSIRLPEMDGYETCRQLKQQIDTQHIPVIFVTELNNEEHETRGFSVGAVDYITKPINPNIVRARVTAQLQLKAHCDRLALTADTDMLTGIPNRRHFETVVQNEWNRALRYDKPLSLIMVDVDHFKRYNDHYGHAAGDKCLKAIANSFVSTIRRASDMVARLGGEEFVCLLPEVPQEQAINLAEQILLSIRDLGIAHADSPVADHVTVSLGLATLNLNQHTTWQNLLQQADVALYQAKHEGRNRLIVDQQLS